MVTGLVTLSGCSLLAVTEPAEPQREVGLDWRANFIREHLRFFNSEESEGRGTASRGYARAAAYVGARMRQFGLQPGLHGDFRLVYQTPINYPIAADLAVVGTDTLILYAGVDFLPDARSDSGSVTFSRLDVLRAVDPADPPRPQSPAAFASADVLTMDALRTLRDVGYRAVLSVGPLRPRTAQKPVAGILIQQLTAAAATQLLASTEPPDTETFALELPHEVRMRVVNDYQKYAGAVNVLGFLSGKHPVRRDELVLVCADLDAVGTIGGVRTLDLHNLGVHAAALLELARNYGAMSQYAEVPERTLLFAVFSGSRLGNAGLRAYLQNPLWDLSKTTAVVYVGLPADREHGVRNLLAPLDISLFAVNAADSVGAEELLLLPEAAVVRRAGDRAPVDRPIASLSELLNEAIVQAQHEAAETHEVLFPLTSGFSDLLFVPVPVPGTAQ